MINDIHLTKTTAAQNEVALSYRSVRGLCFAAVVLVRSIVNIHCTLCTSPCADTVFARASIPAFSRVFVMRAKSASYSKVNNYVDFMASCKQIQFNYFKQRVYLLVPQTVLSLIYCCDIREPGLHQDTDKQ